MTTVTYYHGFADRSPSFIAEQNGEVIAERLILSCKSLKHELLDFVNSLSVDVSSVNIDDQTVRELGLK
jgi:hypothetical protein